MNGFSDEERDRIHEQLIETGRELLIQFGPQKTNIADITEPVGIAKSSFYLFFDSKSELYLEIMHRESEAFRANAERAVAGATDPREGLERLFRCYRDFSENNPLVQQVLSMDDYHELFRNIPADQLEEVQREEMDVIIPYVESLQELSTGTFADIDPTTIIGVMGTIGLLVLHKDEYQEYDEAFYDHVQELHLTALAAGLTSE